MRKLLVLGAEPGSGNIGDAIVKGANHRVRRHPSPSLLFFGDVTGNNCMVGDGSRPPGGNMPNADIAREHGYAEGPEGHYARYQVPNTGYFVRVAATDLVVTLGSTYKDHFTDVREQDIERVLNACLMMPMIAARRFVQACTKLDELERSNKLRLDRRCDRIDDPDNLSQTIRRIIFIGSYAHRHPFTNGTAYCAAKAGLDMAGRCLGWELTDLGYRVHVVHPYHVQGTPMWKQVERDVMASKRMTAEQADEYARKDLKMPDLLNADDVAGVVLNLLTDDSMQWTSGTSIELNGGTR